MLNTLRPIQNDRYYPDDIFNCIFVTEIVWILIEMSLKFVPKGQINKIPALVQIMAWLRPGDKPLTEPIRVNFLTYIRVTRPQCVKYSCHVASDTDLWDSYERSEALSKSISDDFVVSNMVAVDVVYRWFPWWISDRHLDRNEKSFPFCRLTEYLLSHIYNVWK